MSAPMKKHPIRQIEVTVSGGTFKKFVGPQKKLKPLLILLNSFDFKAVPTKLTHSPNAMPWNELAQSRIRQFTQAGLALRGARLKEGLTQVQLAHKLLISQYNLSKMETGTRPIGKKMALRLSKVLKMDYRVFL